MSLVLSSATAFTFSLFGGQIAGMNNVVLHPSLIAGVEETLRITALPKWENQFDLSLIYGSAETATGRGSQTLQELRGQWRSLYPVYEKDEALRFNIGLYSEFAEPAHHSQATFVPGATGAPYALEENENLGAEKLFGADFNLRIDYDRLHADFHNVLFFSGERMGPNLLAYSPIAGFDWRNRAGLIGTAEEPRLDFYTNLKFYFARKSGTSLFNTHDGLGGTKREFDLSYGLAWHASHRLELYGEATSANNLNRGGDPSRPQDFRDGFEAGVRYQWR